MSHSLLDDVLSFRLPRLLGPAFSSGNVHVPTTTTEPAVAPRRVSRDVEVDDLPDEVEAAMERLDADYLGAGIETWKKQGFPPRIFIRVVHIQSGVTVDVHSVDLPPSVRSSDQGCIIALGHWYATHEVRAQMQEFRAEMITYSINTVEAEA